VFPLFSCDEIIFRPGKITLCQLEVFDLLTDLFKVDTDIKPVGYGDHASAMRVSEIKEQFPLLCISRDQFRFLSKCLDKLQRGGLAIAIPAEDLTKATVSHDKMGSMLL
jgi:hypothetical protein